MKDDSAPADLKLAGDPWANASPARGDCSSGVYHRIRRSALEPAEPESWAMVVRQR